MNYSKIKSINESLDSIIGLLTSETDTLCVEMRAQAQQIKNQLNQERTNSELNIDILQNYLNQNNIHVRRLLQVDDNQNFYQLGETVFKLVIPQKILQYNPNNNATTIGNISKFLEANIEEFHNNVNEFFIDSWAIRMKIKLPKKCTNEFLDHLFVELGNGINKIPQILTQEKQDMLNYLSNYLYDGLRHNGRRKTNNEREEKTNKKFIMKDFKHSKENENLGNVVLEKRKKNFCLFFENSPDAFIIAPDYILNACFWKTNY
jgi:hypothetical protein